MANREESLIFRRADFERDLGFGADEGAAGIVGGRTGGDGLAGTGGGAEGGCGSRDSRVRGRSLVLEDGSQLWLGCGSKESCMLY